MNDISLLQQADVAIAMADAPDGLKQVAHIIAGSASDNGIINALNQAIQNRSSVR
jgi:hydroxymethylpyrimidine pyrophosphatase-like HAD family hydrolase